MSSAIRVRFAPSPTGYLHIGGARTAIYNWLIAKKHNGTFILRIEDTDLERSTDASTEAILDGMRWLGLTWDEGPEVGGPHAPYFQTQRTAIYRAHVDQLLANGKAYRCYTTSEELDAQREAAKARGEAFHYDRRWREAGPAEWPADRPFAVRFKAPLAGEVVVDDLVKGRVVFEAAQHVDDFVILRSDGSPTYNFTVVVDDVTMGITEVIRGDDHLNNTPKQILLYEALNYPLPAFAHVPMILGADKTRLSKRHGATSVQSYREMGLLPQAMLNFLVRLGWAHGDQEIFSQAEMIEAFDIKNVGKSAGVFNPEKLEWINQWYIQHDPVEQTAQALLPYLKTLGIETVADARLAAIVEQLKTRSKNLVEMAGGALFFFVAPTTYDPKAADKFLTKEQAALYETLVARLGALEVFDHDAIKGVFEGLMAELNLGLGKLAQPVRVALTGTTVSPGIFESLELVGREESLKRLSRALDACRARA